eukprot:gb/GEZN01015742.1/.p1 GENE.gb/GEZN01015742.1/~~gb/GEZN01015742.1/.p1  ORF type:complete len:176 (+),score=41.00 gb/GEZN01015742.1/:25-528(+)
MPNLSQLRRRASLTFDRLNLATPTRLFSPTDNPHQQLEPEEPEEEQEVGPVEEKTKVRVVELPEEADEASPEIKVDLKKQLSLAQALQDEVCLEHQRLTVKEALQTEEYSLRASKRPLKERLSLAEALHDDLCLGHQKVTLQEVLNELTLAAPPTALNLAELTTPVR